MSLSFFKQLLEQASITPHDEQCQSLLRHRLEAMGFNCETLSWNQTDNLWAVRGNGSPLVCFAGHTDVVPPGNESAWKFPPFKPTEYEGFLYGRGTADMKGGIAAFVHACEQFLAHHNDFKGSIAFLITSDEEGDGKDGTIRVVEELKKRNVHIDYCIIGEPTAQSHVGDVIKNGRRGSLSGSLTIYGKQGHIAYPHLADNPIHHALPALSKLTRTVWDNGNEYFPPSSFQISNLQSGLGTDNVIPPVLTARFNFRFNTCHQAENLQNQVENILKEYIQHFDLQWKLSGNPFLTSEGFLTQSAQKAIKEVCGINAKLDTGGGTSDGRFIRNIAHELIELGPVNASIHQVNECISIEEWYQLCVIYEKLLGYLLKV